MGPHPAVAAIRLAVRRVLHDVLADHPLVATAPARPPGARLPAAQQPAVRASVPRGTRPAQQTQTGRHTGQVGPRAARTTGQSAGQIAQQAGGQPAEQLPPRPPLVLVACSGGADSMALASAVAFEAPRLGLRAGAVTVDHGLQAGSDLRAVEVADRLGALGLDPVDLVTVSVGRDGGPEAAARDARYAALDAVAERHGAVAVLLGHTRDDQAETVLLGLARGSGTRSLSGMARVSGADGRYRRPFLQLDRQTARKACLAQSLPVWDDPHNADPAYTRSRVRHEALPILEKALGKGVVEALARTAQLSRDDADALDAWAARAEADLRTDIVRQDPSVPDAAPLETVELDTVGLHALPPAVRRRVLRRAAIAAGAPAGSLFARHIEEVDRLITGWRGQRAIHLPGRVEVRRQGGRLVIRQG